MLGTSPVAPPKLPLEEMAYKQRARLYEGKEQSGYIATPFNKYPKVVLVHRSSPPLYLVYKLEITRNCVVTADFSR